MWILVAYFVAAILSYLFVHSVLALFFLITFVFKVREFQQEESLKKKVREYVPLEGPLWSDKKRFLVIVNPNSGGGRAIKIFERIVRPMFIRANLNFELKKTRYAKHAGEICAKLASGALDFDVVVCVSGDGLLHECLNGFASSCSSNNDFKAKLQEIPFAMIPAGSCNGVAMNLGSGDAFTATNNVITGKPHPIDLYSVENSKGVTFWDVHYFCWACFSDHDYLIEGPLRSFGVRLKMILAPLIVIARMRMYSAVSDILPVKMTAEKRKQYGYSDPDLLPDSPSKTMKRIKGNFWCYAIGNMAYGSTDATPTPHVQMCEGACDLVIVRKKVTRWRCAQLFLEMETGKHVFSPEVDIYKVTKVHLNPTPPGDSHMQCSGEEIPCDNVTIQSHKGAIRMIMTDKTKDA